MDVWLRYGQPVRYVVCDPSGILRGFTELDDAEAIADKTAILDLKEARAQKPETEG